MYLDITCVNCGPFRHNGKKRLDHCPKCRSTQAIILPHSNEIDSRFRLERRNEDEDEQY